MIGKIISHYKIIGKLGEGGMGIVYKAQDTRLDRIVALKFLPHHIIVDESGKQRFLQEAKAASAVNHSNVCVIYDIEEAEGERFIAMEFVDGVTIRDKYRSGKRPLSETLSYAIQIGDALQVAHHKGIIHRDVKPDNIMVNIHDQIKIMDFGLAKLKDAVHLTRRSSTLGTLAYMSPEQIEGGEIDHRADIFSFGIVLYEMAAQHLPFRGEHEASITYSILHEQPLPLQKYLPDAPDFLLRIVERALEKDIQARYQSFRELTDDLRTLQRQLADPSRTLRANPLERLIRVAGAGDLAGLLEHKRSPLFVGVIGGAIFLTVLMNVLMRSDRSPSLQLTENVHAVQDTAASNEPLRLGEQRNPSGTMDATSRSVHPDVTAVPLNSVAGKEKTSLRISEARKSRNNNSAQAADDSVRTVPDQDHFRIAVLPFANISPDPHDEYFADGMTEELISTLSRIRTLRVIARTSVMQYKGTTKNITAVGRELNVNAVIEGSVRKSGNKLRITVQLIQASTQEHLWSEDYDRDLTDIFAIQADVAQKVAEATRVQVQSGETQMPVKQSTANSEAYTLYLQGRFYWNKRTPSDLLQSLEYYQKAIQKDEHYALAYAGIADTYTILANYYLLPPEETYKKAKEAAAKALAFDETLAEAHASLAFALMQFDWDWTYAEREFLRAIELNPSYVYAQSWYAYFLTMNGRFTEAFTIRKRVQKLDPLSVIINAEIGLTLYFTRNYDESIEQYRKALRLDSNFYAAYIPLGAGLLHLHRSDEAMASFKKGRILSLYHPIASAALAYGYAVTGRKNEALKIADELIKRSKKSFVPPYWIGIIYAGLDDRNAAFAWFEKGIELHDGSMIFLKVEPILDPLRSDPRFTALLAKVGLNN